MTRSARRRIAAGKARTIQKRIDRELAEARLIAQFTADMEWTARHAAEREKCMMNLMSKGYYGL